MGSYPNKMELFNTTNIITSFKNAKLLLENTPSSYPSIEDVHHITKRYIKEQLLYIPSGTKTFDRYCSIAFHTIKAALLESTRISFDMPSFLYTSLVEAANEQTIAFQKDMRQN
ncbi:MAG: hypothetical protein ACKPKO_01745, partial [Candidatus Fonsibacter sp.]